MDGLWGYRILESYDTMRKRFSTHIRQGLFIRYHARSTLEKDLSCQGARVCHYQKMNNM